MDESHFESWSRYDDDNQLLNLALAHTDNGTVDVVAACERAVVIVDDGWAMKDLYAVPTFEPDTGRPTNRYVRYHPQDQTIKYHENTKNRLTTVDATDITDTNLAHRLKWWLPEYNDDIETLDESKLPPETITAIDTIPEPDVGEWFGDIRSVVDAERDATLTTKKEAYNSQPTSQPSRDSRLTGPLQPTDHETGDQQTFSAILITEDPDEPERDLDLRDDAGIFEDNHYYVVCEDATDPDPIHVVATDVNTRRLHLEAVNNDVHRHSEVGQYLTDTTNQLWLYQILNPTPFDRRDAAIRSVRASHEKRDLLTGNTDIAFTPNKYAAPNPAIDLNDSQERALVWALAANDCVCIHGPPGTGKTRTLTAYIKAAVDAGQQVLVCAHSNPAIDNLLVGDSTLTNPEEGTLHTIAERDDTDLTIARVGRNSTSEVAQGYYGATPPSGADVVAATTNGAAEFDQDTFDVAVVDEATQASRAGTLIAYDAAEKLVLAGDHKQLPPFSASDDLLGDEQRPSLYEALLNRYGNDIAVMLTKQYRMHKSIAAFPNEQFYDGMLETATRNESWTLDGLEPLLGINLVGDEQTRSGGHSKLNPQEAEAAAQQVSILLQQGVPGSDIGVIAAYSAQVEHIKQELATVEADGVDDVSVDTVDAFQGSEREAIIVSLVRSNAENRSGFLTVPEEGPRRLNVALTRARKRLVVVGDWETLGTPADGKQSDESCADLYTALADAIDEHGRIISQPDR